MKVYNIGIDTEDLSEDGVFTTSLVKSPAIRENFMYMSDITGSEETPTYSFSEERGEVVGPVLIPDILIPRSNEKLGKYYVTFSAETIEQIQYKMSKDGFFNYFNLEHSAPTDKVFLLETWIKESDNDKSADYGFSDMPNGTLFFKAKIEDEDIKKQIKEGELNGFSVEIKANLLPQTQQLSEEMTNEELMKAVEALTRA